MTVILPLILGSSFYFLNILDNKIYQILKNHLPDGLWAFSLISCLCMIWKTKVNNLWLFLTFLGFATFEYLQNIEIIDGVGDWLDIIFYFSFSYVALVFRNIYLIKTRIYEND